MCFHLLDRNVAARPDLRSQIPYHDTLMDFPFKGDEMALRNMEHAELITITTHNGRPSTIRPGKPVYKFVFERVVGGLCTISFVLPGASKRLIGSLFIRHGVQRYAGY